MNLTLDLQTVVGTHPRKARESCVREMARRGRDMAHTRSVHSQPKPHGLDKEESETLLDLHKQTCLYYACIAKRLGVNASYINRIANGEQQSEELRRALLSELGLMQAAA
jgi:hypothetical protein